MQRLAPDCWECPARSWVVSALLAWCRSRSAHRAPSRCHAVDVNNKRLCNSSGMWSAQTKEEERKINANLCGEYEEIFMRWRLARCGYEHTFGGQWRWETLPCDWIAFATACRRFCWTGRRWRRGAVWRHRRQPCGSRACWPSRCSCHSCPPKCSFRWRNRMAAPRRPSWVCRRAVAQN